MRRANEGKSRAANGDTKERSKWLAKSGEPMVGNKRRANGREYKRGANTKKQ